MYLMVVPNRRKLGRDNVVCVMVLACVGRKRGKREAVWGWVRDLKVGQLTLSMGPARQKFAASYKELPFQERGLFILYIEILAKYHTCNNR
jgi:hypothetical protein